MRKNRAYDTQRQHEGLRRVTELSVMVSGSVRVMRRGLKWGGNRLARLIKLLQTEKREARPCHALLLGRASRLGAPTLSSTLCRDTC
jgi:hypothetical protein